MSRYAAIKDIQALASNLHVGEDLRAICPLCDGGSTHEKSLSVRRSSKTQATFVCYRTSCDLGYGKLAVFEEDGRLLSGKSDAKTKTIKEPPLFSLSQDAINLLKNKYGLDELQIRYGGFKLTADKRIAAPVRNPSGSIIGLLIKKEKELYRGTREYATIPAKWLFVRKRSCNYASWYRRYHHKGKNSDTLIIVEDILSALRLTPHTDSVALLGTDLLRSVVDDIRKQGYGTIWLALDNDAIKKAFYLRRRLQSQLPNLNVMYLEKDIKNMTEEELEQKLGEYCANSFQE